MGGEETKIWDGTDRRKLDLEFRDNLRNELSGLNTKIQLLILSVEEMKSARVQSNNQFERLIDIHDQEIFGRRDTEGIKQSISKSIEKIGSIQRDVEGHIIQDRWVFGIIFTIILAILGILLRK